MSIVLSEEEFEFLFQETILELFFSNWYNKVIQNVEFCIDSPVYFYRYNVCNDLLVLPKILRINKKYILSSSQLEKVYGLISLANRNYDELRYEIIRIIPGWSHFLSSDTYNNKVLFGINNPKDIEITDDILSFFSTYSANFFVQQAYLLVSCKIENYKLSWKLFQSILIKDPGNPFVLLEYVRFLGSACYKMDLNPLFLESALVYIKMAIISLGKDISIFTFVYAWMGQLYHAMANYNEAVLCYNKTIALNESQGFYKEEAYIWLANSFTAMGKYKESNHIYENLFSKKIAQKHSIDFRNFKVMAINYWYLDNYSKFRSYFLKSLKLLLKNQQERIIITVNNTKYILSDIDLFLYHNLLLKNDFESFYKYYSTYTRDLSGDIGITIIYLGWLFLKCESSFLNVIFHDSRGLEKLSLYYLQTFLYENKGIGS